MMLYEIYLRNLSNLFCLEEKGGRMNNMKITSNDDNNNNN